MDIYSIYIAIFFIVFLIMPLTYYTLRFIVWFLLEYCACCAKILNWNRERDRNLNGEQPTRRRASHWGLFYDRQGNIFTISDETTGNTAANRYPDFFYLEPSSDEAARIRAQLEKDDKDLPSYDDVMRMTSVPTTPITPTAILPGGNLTTTVAPTSSNPMLSPPIPPDMTVPPYSEVDPNIATASTSTTTPTATATATATSAPTPSTSRGASIANPVNISASSTIV